MFHKQWLKSPAFWIALFLLLVALGLRLWRIEVPINVDEGHWMRRGIAFYHALASGGLSDTYLRHHPGVTNMWFVGLGISLRYLVQGLSPWGPSAWQADQLLETFTSLQLFVAARYVFALVTALSTVIIFLLGRKLFGLKVAFLAALILLFEPYFLAYQRFITTDANQTNFFWIAFFAYLLHLRSHQSSVNGQSISTKTRKWLVLSAIFFALALLSKVSVLLSLPAMILWAFWVTLRYDSKPAKWSRLFREALLWGAIVILVVFALWPALWGDAIGTWRRFVFDLRFQLGGHDQFFLGETTDAPNAAFFPVVIAYRLSPLLSVGAVLGVIVLLIPGVRTFVRGRLHLWAILLNCLVVLIALSLSKTKIDRYIVPLLPGLAFLAASGFMAMVLWLSAPRPRVKRWGYLTLIVLIIVAQLLVVIPITPYYVAYFNPLLGGADSAQDVLMVGNGEYLDTAANWLNEQPGSAENLITTWYLDSFEPYYVGPGINMSRYDSVTGPWWLESSYVLIYINQLQRDIPSETLRYFEHQKPSHQVHQQGLDYAMIYPGPVVTAGQLADVENGTDFVFDENVKLLGYDVQTPTIESGDSAAIALYWQLLAPPEQSDYQVYVGLRNHDGKLFNKAVNVPVDGYRPIDQWPLDQVTRDVQHLLIPPGTPAGEYTLEVGLFSPGQNRSMTVHGSALGDRVALAQLQVLPPTAVPDPSDDRYIAHWLVNAQLGPTYLLGYDWGPVDSAPEGDIIPITLLWQVGRETEDLPKLYLQLEHEGERWRRTRGYAARTTDTHTTWRDGEWVREVWDALLPVGVPDGRYGLQLLAVPSGATPDSDAATLLDLGEITVVGRDHTFSPSQPTQRQQVDFGETIRFLGYDLPMEVEAASNLAIKLYWQALAESDTSYTRFVHLLAEDGSIVAQQDAAPGDGAYPTTSWIQGEYLEDIANIALPEEMEPGFYRLAIGLYDPLTGTRLMDENGRDMIHFVEHMSIY
ncbi:MAG: hypothetical protein GY759_14005 [Chloroflexi bacterium]|nr:hypothetical protein [Chloroflexota bacterium]